MRFPLAAALLVAPMLFADTPSMPPWLAVYPGATAEVKSFPAYVEASYIASASPAAVLEHYRKLFEAANLQFSPGSDGIGTTVRAAAAECDLLLSIRSQPAGTLVRASCAAKSPTYKAVGSTTTVAGGGSRSTSFSEAMQRHQ